MTTQKTQQLSISKQATQGLDTMQNSISLALGNSVPTDRFMRIAKMAIQDETIAKALDEGKCDKSSLYDAVQKCAADGLVLDKREAALVMFGNKAQYMPMVAGIIKKIWNSDQIESISAHVVYKFDQFSYELGDNEHIHHIPSDEEDPGELVRVYAIAKIKGGGIMRCVMNKKQVAKHRKMSKTDYIWKAWPEEQWEKTALKKLSKRLPQSSELERVFEADNSMINLEEETILDVDPITGETTEPKKKTANKKTAAKKSKTAQAAGNSAQPPIDSTAKEVGNGQADDPGFKLGDGDNTEPVI